MQKINIMLWYELLNLVLCSVNLSAFTLQALVHFEYLNDDHWYDNFFRTAMVYVWPLLGELVGAWFMLDTPMKISALVILCFGWVTNAYCWIYQVNLSEHGNAVDVQQALLTMSRFRVVFWVVRIFILYGILLD